MGVVMVIDVEHVRRLLFTTARDRAVKRGLGGVLMVRQKTCAEDRRCKMQPKLGGAGTRAKCGAIELA